MTIHDLCDYIIVKGTEAGLPLNMLKVQKLAYYAEAWHLAFHGRPLTDARFQAWVHGPVSRELYDRFRDSKNLYSGLSVLDIRESFDMRALASAELRHVDQVLEVYGPYTGSQLEDMTHAEDPWIAARANYSPSERCENELDPELMRKHYAARLTR